MMRTKDLIDTLLRRNVIHLSIRKRLVMHRAVINCATRITIVRDSVFHPGFIVTVWEILTSMGSPGFLPLICAVHRLTGLCEKIIELEGLDEIRVPYKRPVGNLEVRFELRVYFVNFFDSFIKRLLGAEDRRIVLHRPLHFKSNISRRRTSTGVAEFVHAGNCIFSNAIWDTWKWSSRLEDILAAQGASTTKNNNIKKRVGSKPVGAVDGGGCGFTGRHKAWNNLIGILFGWIDYLSIVIRWNTSHVVMDSRKNWNGFFGNIDTGENFSGFRNSR
mmetsp:Transcript_10549/g.25767  ORF Transcript_10549/g.25767 Transcript_10549/m.25767 type:complete len:275 (-) Transcript_10549:1105-1929(-)